MATSAFENDGMFNDAQAHIFENARSLRRSMTRAELALWCQLKQKPKGFKFRSQHPIGNYIVDFYCHKARLIIELDGGVHDSPEVKQNDEIRQRYLENLGIKVIRFTNEQVFQNLQSLMQNVISQLK